MATKKSLVVMVHDTGYGDDLVWHINIALRGKDMIAERVAKPAEASEWATLAGIAIHRLLDAHEALDRDGLGRALNGLRILVDGPSAS